MNILKIPIKNAFRHKLRTTLTVIGIAIAVLAFGILRTVIDAWYAGAEASSATRLVTRNSISLVFPLPLSYKEKIRQIPGVELVSYGNWFGGIYIDEKNFFPNFAIEPEAYLKMYPEYIIPPEQKNIALRERKACIAGRKLAERFGWKTGDTIVLKGSIFPGEWEFVLRAIYSGRDKSTDETQFFFHWDYLNEVMKKTAPSRADQVGFFIVEVEDRNQAAAVSKAIDATFKNSLAETLTETEKAFQMSFIAMTEAIVIAIQLVSFVVIIIIMAVAANTMAMTARERIGEYAILRTLGFGGTYVAIFILGESLVIAALGGVLGLILTFPAAKFFALKLGAYFPVFNVEPDTLLFEIAASILVGIVAALFPIWSAINIRIADGLRRIQ